MRFFGLYIKGQLRISIFEKLSTRNTVFSTGLFMCVLSQVFLIPEKRLYVKTHLVFCWMIVFVEPLTYIPIIIIIYNLYDYIYGEVLFIIETLG